MMFFFGWIVGVICGAVVACVAAMRAASYLPGPARYRPDEWET